MVKRNKQQWKARERRAYRRWLLRKNKIPRGIIQRHKIGKDLKQQEQQAPAKAPAKTQPRELHTLVLTQGPDERDQEKWLAILTKTLGKTDDETNRILELAANGHKPILTSSSDIEELASLKKILSSGFWSLREALRIK